MADFLLKVRKDDYQAALNQTNAALDELESILGEYNALLGEMDTDVIESSDDNFEKTEAAVKENIRITQASKKTGENVRDALEEQVRIYDEASAQLQSTISAAADAAVATFDAAIAANSLLDG